MAAAIRRIIPFALCVSTLPLFAGIAPAQSSDPLPEVRERLKIEAQRIEKVVQDGRMRAYRLLRSDPQEAFDLLKGLVGTLRKDTALPEQRRTSLLAVVQRDLSNLRVLANVRRATEPAAPAAAARVEARRAPDPQAAEASKSVYDTAAQRIRQMNGRVAEARDLRERRGDRMTNTMVGVDKAVVPPKSDYDLPDDWLEKSKRRSSAAKLTEKEKSILESLKKPVKVDYSMETFQSVIDHLSKQMGQDILIDKQSLEEANITYDTPITLRFNKPVSARTALKRVLADVGLTYVIRKESIEVTTPARAREMMTVRTYYVGDLMSVASPLLPAVANDFQMIQAIGIILSEIQNIEPESWEGKGGPGTVTFDPVRMAIVVKQNAEVHYMLNGLR
ncbi:MAG TPA: hypothetical protein VMF69_28050 [Gemmataceae bacterium]|nr:hypothetical protein [Gemmataceae bacterium]